MNPSRRQFLGMIGGAAIVAATPTLAWARPSESPSADPLLHLLNRISYGVRPEDYAYAQRIGAAAYLDEQLHPERVDDSAMDALLLEMPILGLSRHDVFALQNHHWRSYQALVKGMVTRAINSKRQLLERMVEFWADHFNISGDDFLMDNVVYQREVIRRHALGNFRDMLLGVAQSPAMLYYLDNYNNYVGHPNENYARELLELHTLGVDGGYYTETDVKEVARAFTGWTVKDGTETGFYFDISNHDTATKTVVGHQLPAERGLEDGLHVISILVQHPATAHFLCRKLCIRFVSDNPPESLVQSAAAVWLATAGEIVPVMQHILSSAEFFAAIGQKLRRPLDFFIGAMRSTATQLPDFWFLDEMLGQLGQTPYGWHPPDGYPEPAGAWMNTSGLLARWNTAIALTHDAFSDNELPLHNHGLVQRMGAAQTVGEMVDAVAKQVFGVPLPPEQAEPFITFASDGAGASTPVSGYILSDKLAMLWGLMLASPQYQWR